MSDALLLEDDLIFLSKIRGTAQVLGLRVEAVRDVSRLVERARELQPRCVLLNLHHPGLDVADLVHRLGEACPRRPRLVAYGSHVEAALLRGAREAGCDIVLPRSAFVEQLPVALPAWMQEGDSA